MLVSRAYAVLDRLVVEITCVHPGDQEASHLVIREERTLLDNTPGRALRCLADVHDLAASLEASRVAAGGDAVLAGCEP